MCLGPYFRPENRDVLNLTFHGHQGQSRFTLVTLATKPGPASCPENDTHRWCAREPWGAVRRRRGYIGTGEARLWYGDMRPGHGEDVARGARIDHWLNNKVRMKPKVTCLHLPLRSNPVILLKSN